ncbi:MAG: tail fiber assembly protein [Aeromonas sp.]|uniref:tail fiber assembly protein n=1 Tax=Aeromonas sp. TaxID=647 RepID=UPI003F3789B2
MTIEFDKNGYALSSGYMSVHRSDPETKRWLGAHNEFMSVGTGLAPNSYLDGPKGDSGDSYAWCRDSDDADWCRVEDHCGKTAYGKATRAKMEITELGPIPDTHTLLAPISPFDSWNEQAQIWEPDSTAEQQAKLKAAKTEQSTRLANANQQIAILKPAVDGGYAKPEHKQLLADWQRCRYELTLVPEQLGWPAEPQWPAEPEKVI